MDNAATSFNGRLAPGRRPALLLVDLMRAYFEPGSPLCLPSRDCLATAARLADVARQRRIPVVHTRVAFAADGVDGGLFVQKVPALRALFGGGRVAEPMPEVAPRAGELTIVKQYASAFFGTTLGSVLQHLRVDTTVIAGVSTSGCVRASAVDAMQHGFVPLVVRQGVADRDPGPHQASLYDLQLKYAEVVDDVDAVAYLESIA